MFRRAQDASDAATEWEATVVRDDSNAAAEPPQRGARVGNGKVAYETSLRDGEIGVARSLMSVNAASATVAPVFDPTRIDVVFGREKLHSRLASQTLNMYNGTVRSVYSLARASSPTRALFQVATELFAARHLPYTSVLKVTIIPLGSESESESSPDDDTPEIEVLHFLAAPRETFGSHELDFSNNVLCVQGHGQSQSVNILSGRGKMIATTTAAGAAVEVAVACAYICSSDGGDVSVIGFNRSRADPSQCFQKLRVARNASPSTFSVIISQMASTDYSGASPAEETKRILLNLLSGGGAAAGAGVPADRRIRAAHVKAWMQAWRSNVSIEPKMSATQTQQDRVMRLNRVLRHSLYTIWSAVREGTQIELWRSGASGDDTANDDVEDLFMLPLLALFRPNVARGVLSTRHAMLETASALAASYGYQGSQFPRGAERMAYVGGDGDHYWDPSRPMHIFQTALVAIGVWNYYRVSLDKSFLVSKGYAILKGVADYFVSRATSLFDADAGEGDEAPDEIHDTTTPLLFPASIGIKNVMTMNGAHSSDHALTLYLAKFALLCAIEASYEIQAVVQEDWLAVFHNLNMRVRASDQKILGMGCRDDDAFRAPHQILDELIPLTPIYAELLQRQNPALDMSKMIASNVPSMSPTTTDLLFNDILLSWLAMARGARDEADTRLAALLETHASARGSLWDELADGDLGIAAMFVLMVATGAGTLRFGGSVTETRFYTERMGIKASSTSSSAAMPASWKSVKMTGVGTKQNAFNILNDAF